MGNLHSRREEILQCLSEAPSQTLNVNDIIRRFNVTPATIRRDLVSLENQGNIVRTHGFARLKSFTSVPNYTARNDVFFSEKEAIGKVAATLVQDKDSIILDSGTTTCAVAKALAPRSSISVITNSVAIVTQVPNPSYTLILTGGIYEKDNMELIGPDAEAAFDRITASIVFFGTTGIRGTEGMTTATPFHASIKKRMLACAKKKVLVCDQSKLRRTSTLLFANFTDIDAIITAHPIADPVLSDYFKENHIEMLCAYPE